MIKSASRSSITSNEKYRSMSVGNVPSSEFLIETIEVGATAVAAVEFSNLSQYAGTYRHLQIIYSGRANSANAARPLRIVFNGVTTAVYTSHDMFNNGSIVSSSTNNGQNFAFLGYITSGNAVSGNFGSGCIDILDAFNTNKNKVFKTVSGMTGTDAQIIMNSGCFLSTNATSSLSISSFAGSLVQGSRFSLYGVTA